MTDPPDDLGRELKFSTGGEELHRGQWDGYVVAYDARDARREHPLGRLDWQSWKEGGVERFRVKYVEVRPDLRRRGVATRLYKKLFDSEGITAKDLVPASLTPEGAAFRGGARLGEEAGGTHWETRGVLAGAYASRNPKSLLTHSVEVDSRGDDLRVFCGRVALENVADRYGGDDDERPTCPRCAKHFDAIVREDAWPTVITAYHGTDSGPFTRFDPAKRGSATDEGLLGAGFYVSTDPQVGRSSKTTLEVSVRLERPLRIEYPSWSANKSKLVNDALGTHGLRGAAITAEAVRQGYDGVVLDYTPVGYRHQEVVAFDRDQIQILGPVKVPTLAEEGVDDSWEDYLAAGESRYVPAVVLPQMPDVVARAAAAGMPAGAEVMGAGMTGVVFCVGDEAFKVARQASTTLRRMLSDEAEWLAAAAAVPDVAPRVARIRRFDPGNVVIVRDCPRADPEEPRWKWESALFDVHRAIEQSMLPNGWSAPEFKPDSYVLTSNGPILVDASMPSRVGHVLSLYVEDIVEGERPLDDERPSDLAFAVRREVGQTLPQEEADRLQALLERRWPGSTRS